MRFSHRGVSLHESHLVLSEKTICHIVTANVGVIMAAIVLHAVCRIVLQGGLNLHVFRVGPALETLHVLHGVATRQKWILR